MKLMTLNTHSLSEPEGERKRGELAAFLLRELPDAVALQEVCQSVDRPEVNEPSRLRVVGETIPLRGDHFLLKLLEQLGESYYACWLPIKLGYGSRDEGVGFLCRRPIAEAREILLSPDRPYTDWRRRAALAIRPEGSGEWLISLHMSWWEEGFLGEWERLSCFCEEFASVWLMGDFNTSAERLLKEGDPLGKAGFGDAFLLAAERDLEDTVLPQADGWWGRERTDGLRIDQIRCRPRRSVSRYRRVLDGRREPMVSDHFGVMIEGKEQTHGRE